MKRNSMLAILLMVSILALAQTSTQNQKQPIDLRCEYTTNPTLIDAIHPRLSWVMKSSQRADVQTAYRILVSSKPFVEGSNTADMWDSGKVSSAETNQIIYEGKPLAADHDYYWKVMLWDAKGRASLWSKVAKWYMGLLSQQDWGAARWIASKDQQTWKQEWTAQKEKEAKTAANTWPWRNGKDSTIFALHEMGNYDPSPLFRKEFKTNGKTVKQANLCICGLGYYVPYMNGKRVGDRVLNPAWTNYDKRSLYDRYDVTNLIQPKNALGVMLGRGNYEPICNDIWGQSTSSYIDVPKMIALLRITYTDGTTQDIVSDDSWKTIGGPVIYDDTRHGELYDARQEKPGWDKSGYNDQQWKPATIVNYNGKLEAQAMPPVRQFTPLPSLRTFNSMAGSKIYDIGKEIAGWAKVTIRGKRGTKVLVEYCEMPSLKEINPDLAPSFFKFNIPDKFYASFYDKCINIRQQNGYIMKGEGDETFQCMFSYKGFRYIRVSADADIQIQSVQGIPVHTDFEVMGAFECSDPTINKLQQNAINSMYSNFESIPTDCPHREKQGWTCDTYIVSPAANYNFNMNLFFENWLKDLQGTQNPNGSLKNVAPSNDNGSQSTTWPIAIENIPMDMYNFSQNKQVLSDNYPYMEAFAKASMDRQLEGKPDIIDDALGDWLSPHKAIDDSQDRQDDMAPPEGLPYYGSTSHYLAHKKLATISQILGKEDRVQYYQKRTEEIADHVNAEFYDAKSHAYHGTNPTDYRQSTNVISLTYGFAPETERQAISDELIRQIHLNNDHLATGFLGIKSIMEYLPDKEPELAYKMITQPTFPSWGYMVARGATSMWESWGGYDSQNHLPFCMVSEYFYRHLAGIQYDESHPGFRHILIHPTFIASLDHVNCHYNSINGRIESNWKRSTDGSLQLEVIIPANTTASVILPTGSQNIRESGRAIANNQNGILSINGTTLEIGSGHYRFTFK